MTKLNSGSGKILGSKKQAPEVPAAVPDALKGAPTVAVPEGATEPTEKAKRGSYKELYDTLEAAVADAGARDKGPRKVFAVKSPDGKVQHVVHNNEGRAIGAVAKAAGWIAEEIGGKEKRAKQMGVDGLMAALNALPPEERAKVLAQIQGS